MANNPGSPKQCEYGQGHHQNKPRQCNIQTRQYTSMDKRTLPVQKCPPCQVLRIILKLADKTRETKLSYRLRMGLLDLIKK